MTNFFAELSRRKVIRVAAAYGIVSWIILQVIGLVAPNIGLPTWTVGLVLVLLFAGLPIAMILTWGFEATPEGDERPKQAPGSANRLDLVLLAVLVLVGAFSMFSVVTREASTGPEQEIATVQEEVKPVQIVPSRLAIAVLPFADMSQEGDQDWFSDGISEEIIHRLAQQKELIVAGRTSSFYFKNKNVPFEEIGRILNVGTVLEGSVRKFENRIRITAQLIDIESGAHRWSGTFDREMKDIFRIQDELSVSIATELLRELGLEPTQVVQQPYEPNIEAYQLYLRANQIWSSYTQTDTFAAARLFQQSADLDPNYLSPLTSLMALLAFNQAPGTKLSDVEAWDFDPLFEEALKRVQFKRDEDYLRGYKAIYDRRLIEADQYFQAYAADPGADPQAMSGVAHFLILTGRAGHAIPILEGSLKTSPLDTGVRVWLGRAYTSTGRNTEVVSLANETAELGLVSPGLFSNAAEVAARELRDFEASEKFGKIARSQDPMASFRKRFDPFLMAWFKKDVTEMKRLQKDVLPELMQQGLGQMGLLPVFLNLMIGEDEEALVFLQQKANAKSVAFLQLAGDKSNIIGAFLTSDPRGRKILKGAGYDLAWFDEPQEVK